MLKSSECYPGCEQYEKFTNRGKTFVQYDYRYYNGELFSCVGASVTECREKRDVWLKERGGIDENGHIIWTS
jgi:hypothetical protein